MKWLYSKTLSIPQLWVSKYEVGQHTFSAVIKRRIYSTNWEELLVGKLFFYGRISCSSFKYNTLFEQTTFWFSTSTIKREQILNSVVWLVLKSTNCYIILLVDVQFRFGKCFCIEMSDLVIYSLKYHYNEYYQIL